MRGYTPWAMATVFALGGSQVWAQLQGPPAGVPVPPAPIAAEQPKPEPEAAVPAGDLHFRVRLLDGRSSLPIRNGRVRVWYDERNSAGYLLTTDQQGEALLPAPSAAPVRVLAVPDGLFDCRKLSDREAMPGYNLQQIANKGVVTENHCESGSRAASHAGELTLFARPPRWYEKLNQGSAQ
ncbi:hypothetical protein GCM10022270_20930 [Terriglobus aquaticus]